MRNLLYRLIMFIDSVNIDDLNYKIALYMVRHFAELGNMRINELARECYVSAATISRFCREIGYENYAELKQECLREIDYERTLDNLIDVPTELMLKEPKEASTMFIDDLIKAMKGFSDNIDWDSIDHVLNMIHDYDDVTFYGIHTSNSVARHLQGDLMVINKFTYAPIDIQDQEIQAKMSNEDSLAIIISVKGHYFIQSGRTAQYLERSGCKIVLVTILSEEVLPIHVDYILPLNYDCKGQEGKHILMALVELMAYRYNVLYNPTLAVFNDDVGGTVDIEDFLGEKLKITQ